MYPEGGEHTGSGLLLPVRQGDDHTPTSETNWHGFIQSYGHFDALITLSRHKATIGPTPGDTIRLFWHFMNDLYESIGSSDTIFIWIVDIGVRQVEDENAWKDFINFEMLKTQFRAFASFDSEIDLDEADDESARQSSVSQSGIHAAFLRSITIPEEGHREKRWKWLCERSVVIVQNLRKEEFEHLYADEDQNADDFRLRDIGVTTESILPSMIPSRWSQLKELRELYGRDLSDISDATLTVLFNRDTKSGNGSGVTYLAHALNPKLDSLTPSGFEAASRELPAPGSHYTTAMGLAYWAARHRLKSIRGEKQNADHEDWEIAVAYLANQGFRVIRLQEFMSIHRSPGD